jgi:hypothetical protein
MPKIPNFSHISSQPHSKAEVVYSPVAAMAAAA